jgi:hypothetical protein
MKHACLARPDAFDEVEPKRANLLQTIALFYQRTRRHDERTRENAGEVSLVFKARILARFLKRFA